MAHMLSYNQRKEFVEKVESFVPEINMYVSSFIDRRVMYVFDKLAISSWDQGLKYLNNKKNIDDFMSLFYVPVTEFFRDVEVWRMLFYTILPKVFKQKSCTIFLPDCSSGHELVSLCVLLDMLDMRKQVRIYAHSRSQKVLEQITKGMYASQSESSLIANFKNIGISYQISDYYTINYHSLVFDTDLFSNVQFLYSQTMSGIVDSPASLVLYRNALLYYSKEAQRSCIGQVHNAMKNGGYLFLGLKEGKNIVDIDMLFSLENARVSMYKK
ncbi:MAG: CheR family methyltransferase [Bacteroidales bacterium]